jgi:hypothetical protein
MSQVSNLARRLIAYDRVLARRILVLLVEDLGGPRAVDGELDIPRMRSFLDSFAAPEVGDPRKTTQEWKDDFAHRESMRALADELLELLR